MGPWSPRPHGLQPTNWRPLAVGAPPQTHTVQGPHSAPCAPEHKAYASLISMSGRKRVGGVWGTHTWRNTTILGTAQPSAPSPEWGFEKYEEPGRVCLPLRAVPQKSQDNQKIKPRNQTEGCRFPHKLKGQDGENGCFGGALGGSAAHELYFMLAARDFTNDPINIRMR